MSYGFNITLSYSEISMVMECVKERLNYSYITGIYFNYGRRKEEKRLGESWLFVSVFVIPSTHNLTDRIARINTLYRAP
jgi:hypothetical protein